MEIKSIRLNVKRVLLTGVLMGAAVVSLRGAASAGEGCYRGYRDSCGVGYGCSSGYVARPCVPNASYSVYGYQAYSFSGYQSQGYVRSYSSGYVRAYRGYGY